MAEKGKPAKAVSVDFSDTESSRRNCPDGQYILEVHAIEEKTSGEGNLYWSWRWKVAEGEYKGVTIWDNTSLLPQALWRIRGLLECLGIDISGKMKLDPSKYLKRKLLAEVVNETYQGKTRPKIAEFVGPAQPKKAVDSKFKVGDRVSVEEQDETFIGEVIRVTGKDVIVKMVTKDGEEEWELTEDDLELAPAEEKGAEDTAEAES